MAKTYEELLEQAAIIRDETAAGKNTATRVGGTITDAVDYVKNLQDTYAGIHAEASEAKTEAAAAKVTAAEAKTNAGSARSIAQSAVLTANGASRTATDAKANADAAKATAEGIAATAQAAKDIADAANAAAQDAKETAEGVAETAQAAKDIADSAKQTADAASNTANAAKTESAQAVITAQAAQNKNAEQDNRLKHAEEQNTKQNERLLNYVYPKIYQLNEGAGARVFDGFTEATGEGGILLTKDTYRYRVLYSTTQKQFVLNVTDEASGAGVRVGTFAFWGEISLPNNKFIASSESYALRDCLYYIYVEGEGSTYYYIDSNGVASEKSATYLLRLLANKNAADIATNTKEIARVNSTATQAQESADRAQDAANTAQTTADSASSAATTAQTAADNAQETANNAQTKNTEQDARLEKIENNVSHLFSAGRYWNEANGTPTAAGHYGNLDALRLLPERLGLGRYLVKDDRTRRKLDPKDSTKYADDGTDAKLDGTDGQCMWCWNGFYANVWKEGDNLFKVVSFDRPVGNDISIWIPAGGISWLGAGVIDRGDAPFTDKTKWKLCSVINNSEQFRGGSGTALDASKYTKAPADTTPQITMLGMPATNISTTAFGTYARKRGEGWEANWFVARFVVEFLFEIIMGTENRQEAFNANKDANGLYQGGFGTGVTDMPDWGKYNGSYPVIPTSVGLEAGDGVCLVEYKLPQTNGVEGDTYKTFNVPVFFGLVGAGFGHLWQFVHGLIMDAGEEQSLVYAAPSMYAAYDPNTVGDKIMVAECPIASGWIMRKSYRGLCCMPTAIGGSTNIRYSDYFYTNADTSKGLRVRAAGGNADVGTNAGASCTSAKYAAANASPLCSAPLCYFDEDPKIPDSQSIANNN